MDITPKYNLIAVAKTGTDEKKVTLKSAQDAKVGSTEVQVTLPDAFKGKKVYINHNNGANLYVATADEDGKITFTTNGFSPFTFALTNSDVVAEVNGNAHALLRERKVSKTFLNRTASAVRFSFACQRRFSTVKWKTEEKGKEKEGNSMPIGVIVNCISVLAGGVIGSALGQVLPNSLKEHLPTLFGMCSIAIGINSIIKAVSMTAVVLAILVGFTIGHLLHLEDWASRFFHRLVKTMHLGGDNIDMEFYITAVALFCCSGFGWYSTLTEGIAGDPNLLFAKSVLDFFTAMIFASTLGKAICAIPLPQCVILLCVFTAGRLLSGALTPEMFADLSACGGVLTMSAGFRVSKIKSVPLVDLMPALILVMPFSALWTMLMG